MKRKTVLGIIAFTSIISMSLTGCGKKTTYTVSDYKKQVFEKDGNTLSNSNQEYYNEINGITDDKVYSKNTSSEGLGSSSSSGHEQVYFEEDLNASEVTLENTTGEAAYTVNGDHVDYNGTTYMNLYANALKVDTSYSTEDFINFVISIYPPTPQGDLIYTLYTIDEGDPDLGSLSEGSDYTDLYTFQEELELYDGYTDLVNKYETTATWRLDIYTSGMNNLTTVVGCQQFIAMLEDTDGVVDLSGMDASKIKTSSNISNTSGDTTSSNSEPPVDENNTSTENSEQSESTEQSVEQEESSTEQQVDNN
jgi:hypothetical protein